jgi:hypothetical protein
MRHLIRILLPVILLAMTVSCGLDSLAGGSGTETVNTFAALADGTPAQGATVWVIDPEQWLDSISEKTFPVILRTVADSQGRIVFVLPDRNRPFNIQVDHSDQGLLLQSITASQLTGDTILLEPYASCTGSFTTVGYDINQMYLSGSTYQASIGSEGNFFFNNVAAGTYTLVGVSGAPSPYRVTICGAITLSTSVRSTDTALNTAFNRLLVDNFESGLGPTSLGGIAPELWWFTVSDSGMLNWKRSSSSWRWTPSPYAGHSYTALTPIIGDNGGTALRFTAVLNNTVASPLSVTAGIYLKDLNKRGLDLSAMTGFSMRSRGKGMVRVRFQTANLDSISMLVSAYTYQFKLTDTWQQSAIPVDSLRILEPVYFPTLYPWSKESKRVLRIEFVFSKYENAFGDSLRLDLDDFFLEGVGVDVLKRSAQ